MECLHIVLHSPVPVREDLLYRFSFEVVAYFLLSFGSECALLGTAASCCLYLGVGGFICGAEEYVIFISRVYSSQSLTGVAGTAYLDRV